MDTNKKPFTFCIPGLVEVFKVLRPETKILAGLKMYEITILKSAVSKSNIILVTMTVKN